MGIDQNALHGQTAGFEWEMLTDRRFTRAFLYRHAFVTGMQ
jgi:hypothetical protein